MIPVQKAILKVFVCAAVLSGVSTQAAALTVRQGEYKLPARIDPEVTTSLATELWAQIYRPAATGNYPLVLFLHGNHATCGRYDPALGIRIDDRIDYTFYGTCPDGYEPVPSHLGFSYLARALAARGYVVVSINANRGINGDVGPSGDWGLNLRRGRLVLRHLEELAEWNAGTAPTPASLGFTLVHTIDFSHVGLMGHSRGGEGVRAAVALYTDPSSPWPARIGPVTFEGVFEIAPVDGQTSRTLNATDLAWNVLLPGCDGDVTDLEGVRVFDRALAITSETLPLHKSTFEAFGANHNFFNTEWRQSDSADCVGQTPIFPETGTSSKQQKIASLSLVAFMRAHVGAKKVLSQARSFDPSYRLTKAYTSITTYARGFTATPQASENLIIDNFDKPTPLSSHKVANDGSGLTSYVNGAAGTSEDPKQRAASVSWSAADADTFLQTNASEPGVPIDATRYGALEFRVALQCSGTLCDDPADPTGDVDFSIALAQSDGTLSAPVPLKSVAVVRRPVGSFDLNEVFQTVRIPLTSFAGANLAIFRGVRFTFDGTPDQSVYLANVRLTTQPTGPGAIVQTTTMPSVEAPATAQSAAVSRTVTEGNDIVGFTNLAASTAVNVAGPVVEIEVASTRGFPVGGAMPELRIGARRFTQARFADGATDRLIFTLTEQEFDALDGGAPMIVRVGAMRWDFGALAK